MSLESPTGIRPVGFLLLQKMSEKEDDENYDHRRKKVSSPDRHKIQRKNKAGRHGEKVSRVLPVKYPEDDGVKDRHEDERASMIKARKKREKDRRAGKPSARKEDHKQRDQNDYIVPVPAPNKRSKLKPGKIKVRVTSKHKASNKSRPKTPENGLSDKSASEMKDSESPKELPKHPRKVVVADSQMCRLSSRPNSPDPKQQERVPKASKKKVEVKKAAYFNDDDDSVVSNDIKAISVLKEPKEKKHNCPTILVTPFPKPPKPQKDKMAGAQDYPTMDEVLSDWGEEETPKKGKEEKS
ncbi:unnamed protein product [Bursaphelenchus xylophilus]|uniref:(pine wood nematode) hypothetical protein n=1 Tax=Bursaphelenchus xylophilus TaxID=6326 RepID=A0A1I7SVT3_BURXY|nr:unnamed protein product [Bursaphelenchus xylophilus]CAG9098233.1 unnamed protein product [Bursaphelenchus xylophilus]